MDRPATQRNDTTETKTGSFALQTPAINLPKGGGALRSIDEKFKVNASNGTLSFSIPLPFSAARNQFVPSLSLTYNSGSGSSAFGLGWNCELPAIQRKTEKTLPRYHDAEDPDTFLYGSSEDLVAGTTTTQPDGTQITRYRPRIDTDFSRIEKIQPKDAIDFFWRITDTHNTVTIFGKTAAARIADPSRPTHIFKWLPELSYDDKGSCMQFIYKNEDEIGMPLQLPDANRFNHVQLFANTYLKSIQYGNASAYYYTEAAAYNPPAPVNPGYLFETVFDYGDHDELLPVPAPQQDWPCRLEPFSDYRPGFDMRTLRLCHRILFFHHFKELNDNINPAACLVKSIELGYKISGNAGATPAERRNAETDYIVSIIQSGYIRQPGGVYSKKSLPPLSFSYQENLWDTSIKDISRENLVNDPAGIAADYTWTDLWSEGISGILTEQANAWYYKSNLGNGDFSAAQLVSPKPSFTGINNNSLQLQELEGDGRKFIVSMQGAAKGYFELSAKDEWQPFRVFDDVPTVNTLAKETKFIDLNGDGKPEIVVADENIFNWYPSKGIKGYGAAETALRSYKEDEGPSLVTDNELQRIFMADMSGDGLTDIVRIANGEIAYWPNMGYGKFGAKISMAHAPVFDTDDQFNPAYLKLADISGTGATDIIYLGRNAATVWFNLAGNGWSEPRVIDGFPSAAIPATVNVMDFLGNGTGCIVWSSPLPQHTEAPLRYIDLMAGKKPFIMDSYKNNCGKETSWQFKSSSQFYLEDKKNGKPWITKLPFPVQCVSRTTSTDRVSGNIFTQLYSYHHGYYDHTEKEFRGFARVEQTDTDDFALTPGSNMTDPKLHQHPVKTISWFHTGFYDNAYTETPTLYDEYNKGPLEFELPANIFPVGLLPDEIQEAARSLKGSILRQEIYGLDATADESIPYLVHNRNFKTILLASKSAGSHAVFHVHENELATFYYERNYTDPRITHSFTLTVDSFGNILESASVAYGRVQPDIALPAAITTVQQNPLVTYNVNTYTNSFDLPAVYRSPAPTERRVFEITDNSFAAVLPFTASGISSSFVAATEISFETNPDGSPQKRLVSDTLHLYLDSDLLSPLAPQLQKELGLLYQSYELSLTPSLINHIYGTRADAQVIADGKYAKIDGINWWIPSGRNIYLHVPETMATAQQRFLLPVAVQDQIQNETTLTYDAYNLFLLATEDPLHNITSGENPDYRTLQPLLLRDANNNVSEILPDELSMVIATSVSGDEDDGIHGDAPLLAYTRITPVNLAEVISQPHKFLQKATSYFYYDLTAWMEGRGPVCFAGIERQTHESELGNGGETPVFLHVGYSNGMGGQLQTKAQAEPGEVLTLQGGIIVPVDTTPNLRWVVTGRTILNNKGNTVKQYEPFFSANFLFEPEDSIAGIGFPITYYYDAPGRNYKTVYPDGTLSKTSYAAWQQLNWDANDTVLESQWFIDNHSPNPMSPEPALPGDRAAWLSAQHAGTPAQLHFDSLGRSIYSIADNGAAGKYGTQTVLDIKNNQLAVIDARNNAVVRFNYDITKEQLQETSMDAGERFFFPQVTGKRIYSWDSRSHRFRTVFDELQRPLQYWLKEDVGTPDKEVLTGFIEYGENIAGNQLKNLRGKVWRAFDQSGMIETGLYDFHGNIKKTERRLCAVYKNINNFDVADPLTLLEIQVLETSSSFNAINNPVSVSLPDGSRLLPSYNVGNLPDGIDVFIQSQGNKFTFVENITYNAKAQRQNIVFGNNTATSYTYDQKNYSLVRLLSTRNKGADILQDLQYTYDATGNITETKDAAQATVYFNNAGVDASTRYVYDAIYRLIYAQGREHAGSNAASSQMDEDKTQFNHQRLTILGNMNSMQRYEELYDYDNAGNMLQLIHNAGNGVFSNKWTRVFTPSASTNRIDHTQTGADGINYSYDNHGNLLNLQNGSFGTGWDYADKLQRVDSGAGSTTWFVYDNSGKRVRKITENGGNKKERIYTGSFEIYRETTKGASKVERQTIHVMDGEQRFAMIETRVSGTDDGLPFLLRYQYGNQTNNACIEMDGDTNNPRVISYEEYYPYGGTACQLMSNQTETPKRYRFTGKERDEETGLYYIGARYYAPWLCRWISTDPAGLKGGTNDYSYCKNNPVMRVDPAGTDDKNFQTTYTDGKPNYTSTGDQASDDSTKPLKAIGSAFIESDDGKALKDTALKPFKKIGDELKLDDKIALGIFGGVTAVALAYPLYQLADKNPDLPGGISSRKAIFALGSFGIDKGLGLLTDERLTASFDYDNAPGGKGIYGFELTLKAAKDPEPEKEKPGQTPKTAQQKEEAKVRAAIEMPAAVTIGGKYNTGGGGEGSLKLERPTDIGRFSVAPGFKINAAGTGSFATDIGLTTQILGQRVQFTGGFFLNQQKTTESQFDVKYDDKSGSLAIPVDPPLTGNGFTFNVVGQF